MSIQFIQSFPMTCC